MGIKINFEKIGISVSRIENSKQAYEILLDPKYTKRNSINVTSHGHTDHLPTRKVEGEFICSEKTEVMIKLYRPKSHITRKSCYDDADINIKLYDAGHSLGSRMVLIKDKKEKKKILYTGDYNTIKKYCGAAKPRKCDILIVDSTFGNPRYIFPDYGKTIRELLEKIKDNIENGLRTRILSYNFGKPQEICHILDKNKISFAVDDKILKINELLGLRFDYNNQKSRRVIVARKKADRKEHVIAVSGHAIDRSYRYITGADSTFIISDHTDFNQGIDFVRRCRPEKVYTVFGYNKQFAESIKKILGIQAMPLKQGQTLIEHFR